jgi:diguanylate cyclase (GGDEF)-like protein/PAS domain S-box-containing protein
VGIATTYETDASRVPIDALPLAAAVYDARELRILGANRAAARLLGYTVAELKLLRLNDVMDHDQLALLRASVAASGTSTDFRGPFRLRGKNGDEIAVDAAGAQTSIDARPARLVLLRPTEPVSAPVAAGLRAESETTDAPLLMWTTDTRLRLATSVSTLANGFAARSRGIIGTPIARLFANLDGAAAALQAHRSALEGTPSEYEVHSGNRHYRCFVDALRDTEREIVGVIGLAFEISEQFNLKRALNNARSSLRIAEETARVGTFELDVATGQLTWSKELRRLLDVPPEAPVTGETFFSKVHPEDRAMLRRALREARKRCVPFHIEHRVVLASGVERWLESSAQPVRGTDDRVAKLHGAATDITARKKIEAELAFLAHYDPLTGLPNRTLLTQRLTDAIADARRRDGVVSVIFVDLDGFKRIADSYGLSESDQTIRSCAERIRRCTAPRDTVARISGDKFVVVLADVEKPQGAARTVKQIQAALAEPVALGTIQVGLRASYGISCYPGDGDSAEQLIGFAEMAMSRAKQTRRGDFAFFESQDQHAATQRLRLEHELRDAIRNRHLEVYYQPIVDARTRRVDGVEALVRWQHPGDGLQSPAGFIPLAEETGLIVPLGEYVLHEALTAAAALHRAGYPELRVAVNLSPRQLVEETLAEMVRSALAESGVPPRLLDLEVTESYLVTDPARAAALLEKLAALGIRIALDDFGTGYSALSFLRQFPVHQLKLDRSFVTELEQNVTSRAIAATIINLAHTLDMRSLAEGVETYAQYCALDELGCEAFQGYHFARPMPFGALIEHLRAAG